MGHSLTEHSSVEQFSVGQSLVEQSSIEQFLVGQSLVGYCTYKQDAMPTGPTRISWKGHLRKFLFGTFEMIVNRASRSSGATLIGCTQ